MTWVNGRSASGLGSLNVSFVPTVSAENLYNLTAYCQHPALDRVPFTFIVKGSSVTASQTQIKSDI